MNRYTTHEVFNQPPPLENYNLFVSDHALREAVVKQGADWALGELAAYGEQCGKAETIALGFAANQYPPRLHTHDARGVRVDAVEYHPAYHQLMAMAIEQARLPGRPWTHPGPGAQVARAAFEYMQSQIDAGHGCPLTMSFAAVPTLRKQPNIANRWEPLLTAPHYDASNRPGLEKPGVTLGMGMTEKQGGSDVRANTTAAKPLGSGGPGERYQINGHKYFLSAPMSDGFLVLAQAPNGLSCFLMPRWREDDSKNGLEIQQLKDKVGNISNASSEVEFRDAEARLIGEEGRGVANIIEMVSLTRFDCMVGSSAGMRQAVAQVTHHAAHRQVFGKPLDQQPLMQNVLADLALESEAALWLTLRTARALDHSQDEREAALFRILAPIGKYWICKRAPGHAYEAMECIGGRGAIENTIMPRLYREAPINAIWEGSGNVQCLDVFRAMQKQPQTVAVFFDELNTTAGYNDLYDGYVDDLKNLLSRLQRADADAAAFEGRVLVESCALAAQACVLLQNGNPLMAESFCISRLGAGLNGLYGCLPPGIPAADIIERARPGQ